MTQIVIRFLAVAAIVVVLVVVLQLIEQHRARKFAARIVGSVCPGCGEVFDSRVVQTAREEHGFDLGGRHVSVICLGCARRWCYFEGTLTEIPV